MRGKCALYYINNQAIFQVAGVAIICLSWSFEDNFEVFFLFGSYKILKHVCKCKQITVKCEII